MNKSPIICIAGPTAAGKTALTIALSEHIYCDVISVDSGMIYRGMDIGTAKPSIAEQTKVPHQLIDILDPSESYSTIQFCADTIALITESQQRGRIPVLVGGTMLYFNALLNGMSALPKSDPDIRLALQEEAKIVGWEILHQQLQQIDTVAAQRIHPNDPQRISRALEVWRQTGKTLTELTTTKTTALTAPTLQFALIPEERSRLHILIAERFELMLASGFEQEVKALFKRTDLHQDLPAIRCVGYRQMWDYLANKIDYNEMQYRAIVATRQLAKRQLTWLRRWSHMIYLKAGDQENISRILTKLKDYTVSN